MDSVTAYKIKRMRERGMTQIEVADTIGVSRRTVQRCESRGFGADAPTSTRIDTHDYFLGSLGDGNYRARVWADDALGACSTQTLLGSRYYSETPEEVAIALELLEEYEEFIKHED